MWSSIKKYWQKLVKDPDKYILVGLAATLPFEAIPSHDVFGITLRISLLFGIVAIVRASYLLILGKRKLALSWPLAFLVLYLVWIACLAPFAHVHSRALIVVASSWYVALLALSIGLIYQKKYLATVVKAILIVATAVCGFAIFQYIGDIFGVSNHITFLQPRYQWPIFGFPRVQSTLLEPLYLSAYLLLPISVVAAYLLFVKKLSNFKWYAAALVLYVYVLALTVSRGGAFAIATIVLVGCITYFFLPKSRSGKWPWFVGLSLLAYCLALLTILFVNKPATTTQNKNTGISSYSGQISNLDLEGDSRAQTRGYAIKLFLAHPVQGVGPGQFGIYMKQQYPSNFPGYPIVNNEPIELLAESGLIGLIAILGFFVSLVVSVLRKLKFNTKFEVDQIVQLGLLGFLAATAVQYQSYSTLYVTTLWFSIGLLLALSATLLRVKNVKANRIEKWFDQLMVWLKQIVTDHWALLIILAGFGLSHLYKINAPILDTHAWRQSDTLGVARNFLEESANIFYPRIDIRQTYSGITGMEFPLYNYLIFLIAKVVGLHYWIGRGLSTLAGLVGIGFLYGLLNRRFNKSVAIWGALFMATSPLWFYFSRNIQPDVTMVAFGMASLYFAQRYTGETKTKFFVTSILTLSIAMLVKLPAITLVVPLFYIMWPARSRIKPWQVLLAFVVVVAPSLTWYQHSQLLSNNFGLKDYFYEPIKLSVARQSWFTKDFWIHVFVGRIPSVTIGLMATILLLPGIFASIKKRDWLIFVWGLSAISLCFLFPIKYIVHVYYSLPFVPILATTAALGTVWLLQLNKNKLVIKVATICLVVILLGYCLYKVRPYYRFDSPQYTQLEAILDNIMDRHARIVTNAGEDPIMMYQTHRKGFAIFGQDLTIANIGILQKDKVDYLVIDKRFNLPQPKLYYDILFYKPYEDDNFIIYLVRPPESTQQAQ